MRHIDAGVLRVAYDERGPADGSPVFLLHGFPYDVHAYDDVAPRPDFVDVVIHSYRHRYGLVAGDPAVEDTERRLAGQPRIAVPTIALDGDGDGVVRQGGAAKHAQYFSGPYERRVIPRVGHNLPQEAPDEFAAAVLAVLRG